MIQTDWEKTTANANANYLNSPANKHQSRIGSISPDSYASRGFNRKMKMHDSFVNILPSYTHVPKTVFTTPQSHITHTEYKQKLENPDEPITDIMRYHTHKMDEMKEYKHSMYMLGNFAPQPRKGK